MNLKVAVCDDNQEELEYIAGLLLAWAKKHRHLVEAKRYAGAKAFLFDYSEEKDFDILILDVEMPEMSGIDLAKAVRAGHDPVQIIFVTGFYEYFSDGFDVSALHYLIKPADADKLEPVLNRAVENLQYRQRSVLVSTPEGDWKIPLADIVCVEAENVYIHIRTVDGSYQMRTALDRFSENLDDTFFRTHRSYIVNLKYIKKLARSSVELTNGLGVPLSRGRYRTLHEALMRYL